MTQLKITFKHGFELLFDVYNTSIATRWLGALKEAQSFLYPIDDPKRFYGFNSAEEEKQKALDLVNNDIDIINEHEKLIDRYLTDVNDQDTLNYLHHIFEVYHGLLDHQDHPYYVNAPDNVRKALADLNIHVHGCEIASRALSTRPQIVLTWYGLPKTRFYEESDFEHITRQYKFGEIYINYTEIGKTLEDLYVDNDNYIHPEAFRPIKHFSADFNIKFHDVTEEEAQHLNNEVEKYGLTHKALIEKQGYNIPSDQLRPGFIPVARINTTLTNDEVLKEIRGQQEVINVSILE